MTVNDGARLNSSNLSLALHIGNECERPGIDRRLEMLLTDLEGDGFDQGSLFAFV